MGDLLMCAGSHIDRLPSASVVRSRGIIMQETASEGQAQPRKIAPVVAGLGAALVASAITIVLMMNNPSPVAVSDKTATAATQCQMVARKLLVSTTTGSGTVRLRAGSYLSPPIALSSRPQSVVFPLPRPETTPVEEVITIEGNANDVVITSEVTTLRRVFDHVTGLLAFNVTWAPLKTC
jgi:hypothetical protein